VLGHLVSADDLPDPDPDLAGTGQAFTAPAGSTRSNAGSASSPTNSSAEAATPTSIQALEADIRAWAKGWNEDPKPFIWTKPAKQILESIGRLLTRISGAAH